MILKTVSPLSQYAVVVEQQSDGSWLAQMLGWSECRIQDSSREGAIEHLQIALENRFSNAEVLYYNAPVSKTQHPWMKDAGIYENGNYSAIGNGRNRKSHE